MRRIVKLRKQPEAKSCVMFASWPGIGNVSLIAVRYLREKLNAVEMGEIDSPYFFEPTGVVVRDNIVEEPRFPENNFYYWQDAQGENGLVFFLGEEQPNSRGHELVSCVLDVAQKLKVTRIYSCAAAVTHIHHREKSRVWGAATGSELLGELEEEGVILKGNLRIAGLNGLVLGMARERGMEGVCLLGEVPSYAVQIENPKASLAVLEVLVRMIGIEVDLTELASLVEKTSEEEDRITKQATAEYIDQFTEPIWERDEEEE
ncbi:MAG: PAC2 family protein [Dehalococcoidia bacterium]|nr:PAC2 family protein [Dehalococcoidia bacterium]